MEKKLIDKVIRCSYKEDDAINTYQNKKFPDHLHDFYEIMILFKDNVSFVTDESVHHLYANNLIVIPPLKYHHAQVTESTDYKRLILWFTVNTGGHEEFEQLLKNISVVNFSENAKVIAYIDMFLELMRRCDKKHLYETAEAFITNLLFIIQYSNVVYEKEMLLHPIVAEVVEYLNANLQQQNSLKDLSKHFAISSSHLAKLFKSTMHISIIKYVREKQLLQAKQDILEGKNPTVVCFNYGFNDYSCFYKSFKKQFGVSPNKLKANN